MTYNDYCNAFKSDDNYEKNTAYLLLCVRNYLLNLVTFDNLSGEAIPCGFVDLIEEATKNDFEKADKDYLTYIINDFENSFYHISKNLNEKIIRENKIVSISKVKEINSASINWLSKKQGNTVKQKLANSNYKMMAVNRYSSLDTGENRLFKTLIKTLEELLSLKIETLPNNTINHLEEIIHVDLLQTLKEVVFEEISRFENTAPNNTLLSDKHYRIAWKTWKKLNNIDEIINQDNYNLDARLTMIFFIKLTSYLSQSVNFYQEMVLCEFDDFLFNFNKQKVKFIVPNENQNVSISLKELNASWNSNEKGHYCIIKYNNKNVVLYQSNFTNVDEFSVDCDILSLKLIENIKKPEQFIAVEIKPEQFLEKTKNIDGYIQISENNILFKLEEVETYIQIIDNKLIFNNDIKFDISTQTFDAICIEVAKKLLEDKYKPITKNFNDESIKSNNCVIDICGYKMSYSIDNSDTKNFKKNIFNFKINEINYIPMSNSKVIKQSENCQLITFLNVFKNNSFENINSLVTNIKNEISTKKLVYILPDCLDEFQSNAITKNIGINFLKSIPFPKSMGIVFDWQASNNFEVTDFLLIVNFFNNNLTLTLVKSKFDENLLKIIPDTKGITWERFPTDRVSFKDFENNIKIILIQNGCTEDEANYIINTVGVDYLLKLDEPLYFDFSTHWFCLNEIIIMSFKSICKYESTIKKVDGQIKKYLKFNSTINQKDKVKIIIGTDLLESSLDNKTSNLCYIRGFNVYSNYESKVDFPLWTNHIPSLSIKQFYGKFNLMSNTKIIPIFGKKVNLTIKNDFTLPKKKDIYKFPLIIGEDTKESQYEATLKSIVFPLKEDLVCKLKMVYEYGALEPYTLIFEPKDKVNAPFNQLKVEWGKISEYSYDNLTYPKFATNTDWDKFSKYPKINSDETNNLIDWLITTFNKIIKASKYVKIKYSDVSWRTTRNGKKMGQIFLAEQDCYMDIDSPSDKDLSENEYFYVLPTANDHYENRLFARAGTIKLNIEKPYDSFDYSRNKSSLFAFHTVFFNNRSVYEDTASIELREYLSNYYEDILFAYNNTSKIDNKNFYFSILAIMSGSNLYDVCELAYEHLNSKTKYNIKYIGFCLGNLTTQSQKDLFNEICEFYGTKQYWVVMMLSKAFWWNKELVLNIEPNFLIGKLKFTIKELSKYVGKINKDDMYDVTSYFEFILAVFRLRELDNSELNMLLSCNQKYLRNLKYIVETLSNEIIEKKLKLKSFVKINVKTSKQYENINFLIYALLVYINGNDSGDDIIISGIDLDM